MYDDNKSNAPQTGQGAPNIIKSGSITRRLEKRFGNNLI